MDYLTYLLDKAPISKDAFNKKIGFNGNTNTCFDIFKSLSNLYPYAIYLEELSQAIDLEIKSSDNNAMTYIFNQVKSWSKEKFSDKTLIEMYPYLLCMTCNDDLTFMYDTLGPFTTSECVLVSEKANDSLYLPHKRIPLSKKLITSIDYAMIKLKIIGYELPQYNKLDLSLLHHQFRGIQSIPDRRIDGVISPIEEIRKDALYQYRQSLSNA